LAIFKASVIDAGQSQAAAGPASYRGGCVRPGLMARPFSDDMVIEPGLEYGFTSSALLCSKSPETGH